MLNIIKNTINRVFASGVDSDASAFITATGLSGTTQKSAITTLVKDLKSSGLWSKMKAVYPMVTDNYNLLSYTEDFSNAFWNKTGTTVSPNTTVDPNGGNTADTLVETTSSNEHYTNGTLTKSASSLTYTASVYFKNAIGTRNFGIGITNGLTAGKGAIFSTNGTIVSSSFNIGSGAGFSVISTSIQDAGSGWYRAIFTITTDASTRVDFVSYIVNGTTTSYVGNGTSGIYIWGAQLEASAAATTYQQVLGSQQALIASQMKYNLKDARDLDAAFRLTWSGGWTYSATGATPNGTNAYADTKFSPSANLNINSSHLSIYSRTAIGNLPQSDMGSYTASATDALTIAIAYNNSCYMGSYAFNAAVNYIDFANTDSRGLYINTRTSATSLKGFKNNTIGDTSTTSINGVLPSVNTIIGAESFNGVPTSYSTKQYAFASLGNGLSDNDALLLNQIVEKYQVALSRGVQAAQSFYYNSAYSNEANTYFYSTQITGTTQVSAINTLINGLKANNLWAKMKAVYPFVTDYRNLLAYTEDFTNGTYWGRSNNIVTKNTITAPNGTLTGNTFTGSSASSNLYTASPFASIGNNIFSIYVKAGSLSSFRLDFASASFGYGASSTIDLSSGTPGAITYYGGASGWSINVQSVGDGWYRCSLGGNIPTTQNMYGQMIFGIGTLYVWGAQLEIGSTASTYQPVLGANNYSTNVAAQMKFNLVNPQDSDAAFRLAFSGGWTYSTNGAQPNGTNGYADTKLVGNTNVVKGNFGYGIYSRTNSTSNGAYGVDGSLHIYPRFTDSNSYYRIFFNNTAGINNGTSLGLISGFNDSTNTSYSWLNAVKKQTFASPGVINSTNLMLSGNVTGTGGYDNRQLAFAFASEYLNDAQVALFYQLIQQYQTDLSRQV